VFYVDKAFPKDFKKIYTYFTALYLNIYYHHKSRLSFLLSMWKAYILFTNKFSSTISISYKNIMFILWHVSGVLQWQHIIQSKWSWCYFCNYLSQSILKFLINMHSYIFDKYETNTHLWFHSHS
jgi:hypothetical protein